uniref:AP complex mu/sigma subunit domain-containing protein n=1 Tax=Gouania willdenowi TaxID=441366 RepID=A0A8C5GNY5_GOUWI
MIRAILIFNNHGKPRLSKFYEHYTEDTEQQIIRETFHLVSKRDENVCNFLEGGMLIGGSDYKLIYRHYATLYFVFCVDSSESELGILDLIQVFVETLDKCFENVCELDLIFHVDKVHNILAEMVMGGMVLETNMNEIIMQVDAQNKMEKSEVSRACVCFLCVGLDWSCCMQYAGMCVCCTLHATLSLSLSFSLSLCMCALLLGILLLLPLPLLLFLPSFLPSCCCCCCSPHGPGHYTSTYFFLFPPHC